MVAEGAGAASGSGGETTFRDAKGAPTLDDVAALIRDGKAKNVVVMAGAGISTSAGIPDFRSPETGLYANLEKYHLPYPEAIFDIDYFVRKPAAFYALAKELYPGNFKPTPTHYFFRLLKEKKILKAVFTQNIDTLERIAGLDDDSVIEAHGSFAEAECLVCKRQYTKEEIQPEIQLGNVVRCKEPKCNGVNGALVKPKIVFFGEGLPERFFSRLSDLSSADLLIVLGTSLTVQPFAALINAVPLTTPRLLINLETVGEVPRGKYPAGAKKPDGFDFDWRTKRAGGIRDVRWLGGCDVGVERLCEKLGWGEELRGLVEKGRRELSAVEDETVEETLEKVREEGELVLGGEEEDAEEDEDGDDKEEESGEGAKADEEVDALAGAVGNFRLDAAEDVDADADLGKGKGKAPAVV